MRQFKFKISANKVSKTKPFNVLCYEPASNTVINAERERRFSIKIGELSNYSLFPRSNQYENTFH